MSGHHPLVAATWQLDDIIEIRRCECSRELVCDYGSFENAEANPYWQGGIRPLILVMPDYVATMLAKGPQRTTWGDLTSAYRDNGRLYVKLEHEGQQWVWRLFPGQWWDDGGPDILVGRWPD